MFMYFLLSNLNTFYPYHLATGKLNSPVIYGTIDLTS